MERMDRLNDRWSGRMSPNIFHSIIVGVSSLLYVGLKLMLQIKHLQSKISR